MNWREALQKDKDALDDRLGGLSYFIETSAFETLPAKEQALIEEQEEAMRRLSDIYSRRLGL